MNLDETLDKNFEKNLQLSNESLDYLKEISKWAKLISIVAFVMLAIIGIMMLVAGSFLGTSAIGGGGEGIMAGIAMFIYFAFLALIILVPSLYMFRFAKKIKMALETQNSDTLTEGMKNMKSMWKFYGIITIITISLCGVTLLITLVMLGGMATLYN